LCQKHGILRAHFDPVYENISNVADIQTCENKIKICAAATVIDLNI